MAKSIMKRASKLGGASNSRSQSMKSFSEDPFTDHGTSGVKVNGHVLPATTNGLATPMKAALTTYPLFLEVRNVSLDENGRCLPNIMYEAAFKAPSLNVEWSVKYRFAHFRDIFHALEPHCVYAADDAQRRQESGGALEMTTTFPRTHTRRSLGIPLTELQLEERTALLGRWLREVLSKRGKLPAPVQTTVLSFMKLDEKLGDKIGMVIVSKPPKGTAATSDGTADASGSAADGGGGGDAQAQAHAHANGGIVKPTWTDKVRVLLKLGIPVLQHKHRKSKMGALSTRPRILRMYDESGGAGGDDGAPVGPSLYLIEGPSNDGGDWAVGLSMSASDIVSVSAGGRGTETLAASMKKKGEAYARQAEQRCLSIVAGDGSQWDLEVSQLWLNCMTAFGGGGAGGGEGAGGSKGGGRRRAFSEEEDLPSVSLRDQLVGFLNELLTAEGSRQASQPPPTAAEGEGALEDATPFVASRSFQGARSGYVFKTGAVGVGYYVDHGPFGAAAGGKGVKKKRSFFG